MPKSDTQEDASLAVIEAPAEAEAPAENAIPEVYFPEEIVATANSNLNDIVHSAGGTGRISFTSADANGLTFADNGDGTFTIGGKAPAKGQRASIDVAFKDEGDPPQSGTVTVAIVGV